MQFLAGSLPEIANFLCFAAGRQSMHPGGQEDADEKLSLRFDLTIQSFMELAEASKKYPCAKKAWFEYLGEQVEGVTARAE